MLAERAGKEPAGDGEILVVGASQASAVFAGFGESRRSGRDGVVGGQATPTQSGAGRWRGRILSCSLSHLVKVEPIMAHPTVLLDGFLNVHIFESQHRRKLFFGSPWKTAPIRELNRILVGPKQAIPKR